MEKIKLYSVSAAFLLKTIPVAPFPLPSSVNAKAGIVSDVLYSPIDILLTGALVPTPNTVLPLSFFIKTPSISPIDFSGSVLS